MMLENAPTALMISGAASRGMRARAFMSSTKEASASRAPSALTACCTTALQEDVPLASCVDVDAMVAVNP
eukprot:8506445-Pyramimonas_sp.AAC.1